MNKKERRGAAPGVDITRIMGVKCIYKLIHVRDGFVTNQPTGIAWIIVWDLFVFWNISN